MRIVINPCLDMETLEFRPRPSYIYEGPVDSFGGASAASKANEAAQTAFYQQMTGEQAQQFANQGNILAQLQSVWGPVLAAGPSQTGYSAAENAALRSDITDTGAQATANSENAALLREQQQAGGANILPSGADAQILADTQVLGAQKTAQALQQETAQNFATGRTNFENATTALSGVAGLQNPVGYAGTAINAGGQATNAINLVDTQESSSLLNTVLGGLASGAGTAATAFLGG